MGLVKAALIPLTNRPPATISVADNLITVPAVGEILTRTAGLTNLGAPSCRDRAGRRRLCASLQPGDDLALGVLNVRRLRAAGEPGYDDPGGEMRDPHRGLYLVPALTPGARPTHPVNAQVCATQSHRGRNRVREQRHSRGARVLPTPGVVLRYPLDSMNTAETVKQNSRIPANDPKRQAPGVGGGHSSGRQP